jgi:hypothetical protein
MSLFRRIFFEHKDRLMEKGYDEKGLNSPEVPGLFISRLKIEFGEAIKNSLWIKDRQEFHIGIKGYFTADRHEIQFDFSYSYDPGNTRLRLENMKAEMYNIAIDYPIDHNPIRTLPDAEKVYRQLLYLNSNQLLNKIIDAKENVNEIKKTPFPKR